MYFDAKRRLPCAANCVALQVILVRQHHTHTTNDTYNVIVLFFIRDFSIILTFFFIYYKSRQTRYLTR